MELHNRVVRAEFWSDPRLQRLHRDKRLFFQGLFQLAEDSGCLEDDPFGFKINLFRSPADNDITEETLAEWRDEFIRLGMLAPYEANGRRYLFVVNFHKHQKPKNPSAPKNPLPDWVSFEPYNSNPYTGKFTISEEVLSEYLATTEKFFKPSAKINKGKISKEKGKEGEGNARARARDNPPPPPNEEELRLLELEQGIPNWPYQEARDLEHLRDLIRDFGVEIVRQSLLDLKPFYLDHPIGPKDSPRAKLRTFCRKRKQWAEEETRAGPGSRDSPAIRTEKGGQVHDSKPDPYASLYRR